MLVRRLSSPKDYTPLPGPGAISLNCAAHQTALTFSLHLFGDEEQFH